MSPTADPKAAYFDSLAAVWDDFDDLAALSARLDTGLADLGLGPDEHVLDVGCGTGNLTAALLACLSPAGRVTAVDLSGGMVAVARRKVADPRVTWQVGDVTRVALPSGAFDRVICFSVWPHLPDPAGAARRLHDLLRPGGWLHVWHLLSREKINAIHQGAGPAVRDDLLLPGVATAAQLREADLEVLALVDDAERYLVSARRPGRP